MKAIFTQYEHSCVGFPRVILKWSANKNNKWNEGYVTVKGIIEKHPWTWEHHSPSGNVENEMKRFDKWVRLLYSEDVSVQG